MSEIGTYSAVPQGPPGAELPLANGHDGRSDGDRGDGGDGGGEGAAAAVPPPPRSLSREGDYHEEPQRPRHPAFRPSGAMSSERSVLARRPRTEVRPPSSIVADMVNDLRDAAERAAHKTSTLAGIMGLGAIFFADLCLAFLVRPKFINPETSDPMSWQPYLVLNGVALAIGLMVVGLPADLLLLGLSSIFCATGVITTDQMLGGLSNEGVVAVAALCCVSAAIDKTKALNKMMGSCLGTPTVPQVAMLRMALPIVTLGTVFNNTPLVAVMIPIVKDWTSAIGLQASHFMMPLSFVTMLSACITTMGSSTNLLAVQLVPEAKIAFLDLAPVGIMVMLTGVIYCAALGPLILPANSPPKTKVAEAPERASLAGDEELDPDADKYTVSFALGEEGPLLRHSLKTSGLYQAISPTATLRPQDSCDDKSVLEWGDVIVIQNASAKELASLAAIPGFTLRSLGLSHVTSSHAARRRASYVEEPSRKGRFQLPSRKWVAGNEGGFAAKKRSLYEVVIAPVALKTLHGRRPSADQTMRLKDLQLSLSELQITLVAVRGHSFSHSEPTLALHGGEVLLVEALENKLLEDSDIFGLKVRVPEGMPPVSVTLHPMDPWRPVLAVLGLVFTVLVGALELAPLDPIAVLAAITSIVLGTLTAKEMYEAINGPVLLTVAASFGVGAAVESTGLASWLATSVMSVAEGGGPTTILTAVVLLALGLGIVVSNNTTVILLAPLVRDICERRGMSIKMTMIAVIYAANLSFATPFSYQTNMMVMPHGGYVFMDYIKFGVPMMLVCGVVALLGTMSVWGEEGSE